MHTHYVYLIESVETPAQRYVGITADLKRRLRDH
ncbi:MAG: GIY-YIG nuclease family protein, partial [Kiloniellaceae bacterium]